jgi:hypothetical protein
VLQGPLSGCGSELRVQVADPHEPSCRQERSKQPSPNPLRRICFWQRNGYRRAPRAAAGSGRSEHRNVDILIPLARPRESPTGPNVPCERRTDPAEPPPPTSPSASPGTPPPQNGSEHPGVCGVPSERTDCAAYPGFHPGLVCGAPLGHTERLTTPEAFCALTPSRPQAPAPQRTGSTTIVFPQRRPSNHLIEGHTPNPRSGSGTGPERA